MRVLWAFAESLHLKLLTIDLGRVSLPVGCAAFKAVEVRIRAWWVRLLPLPPINNYKYLIYIVFDRFMASNILILYHLLYRMISRLIG